MREIRFRAWDGERMTRQFDLHKLMRLDSASAIALAADEGILMQYTGLKDKYGVEVYEGDIVKNGFGSIGAIEYFTALGWDSGGSSHPGFYCPQWFPYKDENELSYHDMLDEECEIIGNIYENPELVATDNTQQSV